MSDEAPGWHAIDRALEPLCPAPDSHPRGTATPRAPRGPDPTRGIHAYRAIAGDAAPWRSATCGHGELHGKRGDDPDERGFGVAA